MASLERAAPFFLTAALESKPMSTFVTRLLTEGYDPELTRQLRQSVPGMAHWAASGPFGCCCQDCDHYGYHKVVRNKSGDVVKSTFRKNCYGQFHKLTGAHGTPISKSTEACRHY